MIPGNHNLFSGGADKQYEMNKWLTFKNVKVENNYNRELFTRKIYSLKAAYCLCMVLCGGDFIFNLEIWPILQLIIAGVGLHLLVSKKALDLPFSWVFSQVLLISPLVRLGSSVSTASFPWIFNCALYAVNSLHFASWIFACASAVGTTTLVFAVMSFTGTFPEEYTESTVWFLLTMLAPTPLFVIFGLINEKPQRESWVIGDSMKKSERVFRNMADTLPMPMIIMENTNRRIMHFNKSAAAILASKFRTVDFRKSGPDCIKLFDEEAKVTTLFEGIKTDNFVFPTTVASITGKVNDITVRKFFSVRMEHFQLRNLKCTLIQLGDVSTVIQHLSLMTQILDRALDSARLIAKISDTHIAKMIKNNEVREENAKYNTVFSLPILQAGNLGSMSRAACAIWGASIPEVPLIAVSLKEYILRICDNYSMIFWRPNSKLFLKFQERCPEFVEIPEESMTSVISGLLEFLSQKYYNSYSKETVSQFYFNVTVGGVLPTEFQMDIDFHKDMLLPEHITMMKEIVETDSQESLKDLIALIEKSPQPDYVQMSLILWKWQLTQVLKGSVRYLQSGPRQKIILRLSCVSVEEADQSSALLTGETYSFYRKELKPRHEYEWKGEHVEIYKAKAPVLLSPRIPTQQTEEDVSPNGRYEDLNGSGSKLPSNALRKAYRRSDSKMSASASNTIILESPHGDEPPASKLAGLRMNDLPEENKSGDGSRKSTSSRIITEPIKHSKNEQEKKTQTLLNMKAAMNSSSMFSKARLPSSADLNSADAFGANPAIPSTMATELPITRNATVGHDDENGDMNIRQIHSHNSPKESNKKSKSKLNSFSHSAINLHVAGSETALDNNRMLSHVAEADEREDKPSKDDNRISPTGSGLGRDDFDMAMSPYGSNGLRYSNRYHTMKDIRMEPKALDRRRSRSVYGDQRELIKRGYPIFQKLLKEAIFEIFLENLKTVKESYRDDFGAYNSKQSTYMNGHKDSGPHYFTQETSSQSMGSDHEEIMDDESPHKPIGVLPSRIEEKDAEEENTGVSTPEPKPVNITVKPEEVKEDVRKDEKEEKDDESSKKGGSHDTSPGEMEQPAAPVNIFEAAIKKSIQQERDEKKKKKNPVTKAQEEQNMRVMMSPRLKATLTASKERVKIVKSIFSPTENESHTQNLPSFNAPLPSPGLVKFLPVRPAYDRGRIQNPDESPKADLQQFIFRKKTQEMGESGVSPSKRMVDDDIVPRVYHHAMNKLPESVGLRMKTSKRSWLNAIKEKIYRFNDPPRVMIVDDNEMYLNSVKTVSANFHKVMMTAENGIQAIDLYEKEMAKGNMFHFIMLDFTMPEMGGLECARKLREIEKKKHYPRTYILGHSADDGPEDKLACAEAGMDEFKVKPFRVNDFKDLMAKLEKVITEKEIRIVEEEHQES